MSAYEIPNFYVGVIPADLDMSDEALYQFTGVCVRTAANTQGAGSVLGAALVPPVSASTPIIGVLQNNPIVGEPGVVMVEGVTKAKAGGPIAVGQLLKCVSGKFVVADSASYAVAVALESAVDGDVFTILLKTHGKQ